MPPVRDRVDMLIPLNDFEEEDEEDDVDVAEEFDADGYRATGGAAAATTDGGEEEGSISDLNDLADYDDEDDPGVNQEESSPPRRTPPRRRSSARPRQSRRRSSAVSLEKHDSLILSELASLMDEMDDDDLERALNESNGTGGLGNVAGGEGKGDTEADAAAGGPSSPPRAQRLPSHHPVVRRHSAFPLGSSGGRNTIGDTSGGIRPPSLRDALGNALLHRDYMGSNLTVQRRAGHHRQRRNSRGEARPRRSSVSDLDDFAARQSHDGDSAGEADRRRRGRGAAA